MGQQQAQQQANAGHAAAIHEPLHDNGALFIVKLNRRRVDFFCAVVS
ncbi:hypothetical protein SODG_005793 [Sodalis praecaptivus]